MEFEIHRGKKNPKKISIIQKFPSLISHKKS